MSEYSVFDLLDDMAADRQRREFAQRVHAMLEWEKWFMLGYLKYTNAHPDVLKPACPFCHAPAHARACDELRAVLFDPEDDGPAPEDCPPIPDATPDYEGPSPL